MYIYENRFTHKLSEPERFHAKNNKREDTHTHTKESEEQKSFEARYS